MSLVPYVVEQTNRGERSYDIFSRLARAGGGAEIFSWGTSRQVYLRGLEHRLGIPLYPRTGKKTSSGRAEAWAGAIL